MASFTIKLAPIEAPATRAFFAEHGFEFRDAPHAFWQARGPGCNATFYMSGKLLLQGKEADVYRGLLGDESPDARPYHQALKLQPKPAPAAWIGTDETGKGDYFGPLVVAGVICEFREIQTRSGKGPMCFFQLEDQYGRIEVIVFPKTYQRVDEETGLSLADELERAAEEPVLVSGKVEVERSDGDGALLVVAHGATHGNDFCPDVIPVMRWPWRIESGSSVP